MKANQLTATGLNPLFGYKIKRVIDGECKDVCFFRWNPGYQCWVDAMHPTAHRTVEDTIAILDILERHNFGELVVWGCCCPDCHTDAAKVAASTYYRQTRDMVSHGYAPECFPKLMAAMKAETARVRATELEVGAL